MVGDGAELPMRGLGLESPGLTLLPEPEEKASTEVFFIILLRCEVEKTAG